MKSNRWYQKIRQLGRLFRVLVLMLVFSDLFAPNLRAQLVRMEGVQAKQAVIDQAERLEVYLASTQPQALVLQGTQDGKVMSYTDEASQWQDVSSAYWDGTNWVIPTPTTSRAYFVSSDHTLPYYTYIINYAAYLTQPKEIRLEAVDQDPCSRIGLSWETAYPAMNYRTPLGLIKTIPHQLELKYQDLVWMETEQRYQTQLVSKSVSLSQGTSIELDAPLMDTQIEWMGDSWARELGLVNSSISLPLYQSTRPIAHPIVKNRETNKELTAETISAPITLVLEANTANPTAVSARWQIRQGNPNTSDAKDTRAVILDYTGEQTEVRLEQSGLYQLTLQLISQSGGCSVLALDRKFRVTESSLEIPNAFSPQTSPEINDTFRVVAKSIRKFEGRIFDQAGQELFHWIDPNQGWDGRYNGRYVPTGVYFYVIHAEGADGVVYRRSGDINIVELDSSVSAYSQP